MSPRYLFTVEECSRFGDGTFVAPRADIPSGISVGMPLTLRRPDGSTALTINSGIARSPGRASALILPDVGEADVPLGTEVWSADIAWAVQVKSLACRRAYHKPDHHCAVELAGRPATFADVIAGWRDDATFRAWFNATLAGFHIHSAFRWETPAVIAATLARPFEFVLLDALGFSRRPDPTAFADHFTAADVATFPNLGCDATLVVPRPLAAADAYGHLAAFVRRAPPAQRDAFWRAVGDAMAARVGDAPVWLNTAGAGVPWLHVRLDDRPKYYGYAAYR